MYFLQILLILEVFTCVWKNGEAFMESVSNTNDMIDIYDKLLNIDTGYSHAEIKLSHVLYEFVTHNEITETKLAETKEKVSNNLLCCFVFNCRHYMGLIKSLVDGKLKFLLQDIFHQNLIFTSIFQHNIVGMFFILHNLGTESSLDPLWLMYVYTKYLITIVYDKTINEHSIKQYSVLSSDHDIIYRLLTQFTEVNCDLNNMYNHEYKESKYFKDLKRLDLPTSNVNLLVKTMFSNIVQSGLDRFNQIKDILSVDNPDVYFLIDALSLNRIMFNKPVLYTLLNDFAEANDGPGTYKQIREHCQCDNHALFSIHEWVVNFGGCLAIFGNLIKYIIARNAMKYVLEVHSTLPLSKNVKPSTEELTEWILQCNIEKTNKMMLKYTKDIISFLKIDEDEELKFVTELFDSKPLITFSDSMKITDITNRIMNMLKECSKGLHHFPSIEISCVDLDSSYKSQRRWVLLQWANRLNVEVSDSDGNEYEGMLDLFVFKSFIADISGDINFDITRSFFKFSEKIINDNIMTNNNDS